MKFYQHWMGMCIRNNEEPEIFDTIVPGNIQKDYGRFKHYPDVFFSDNYKIYNEIEDVLWKYRTELEFSAKNDERIFFVSEGIDYESEIYLNGESIYHNEGLFSKIEIDITDRLSDVNIVEIIIFPHPKREHSMKNTREEADQCCKPAVSYGWDWHPRLLSSGLWGETYIECRKDVIEYCEPFYILDKDYKYADVTFDVKSELPVSITLFDRNDNIIYQGDGKSFRVDDLKLWWCNGQGEPYLYKWIADNGKDRKTGYIGFRNIKLVMNEEGWNEPSEFPKTRSVPPTVIELNGRPVFAKGSNWVSCELFPADAAYERYKSLLELAKKANFNILRCWGGAHINRESFFELCDELGIMVWQEFPLACNNYRETDQYLKVLEQEAISIIKRLRKHACLVLWCGGNELFNSWSGMTDQSMALRLLNKLCYEYDHKTPFIMTSPLMGMAHGPYTFYVPESNKDVFQLFNASMNTAFTEFGIPSLSEVELLRRIIPEDEIFPVKKSKSWIAYHAFDAWKEQCWLCKDITEKYFGIANSIEELYEQTIWLQSEGYKYIFEECRRKKPYCSMAINWCFNEPWTTAANNSIIQYPDVPKESYYSIQKALSPIVVSARIPKFDWESDEEFKVELWVLNDSQESFEDKVEVWIETVTGEELIHVWDTGKVEKNENKHTVDIIYKLPSFNGNWFKLRLESKKGYSNEYKLLYRKKEKKTALRTLNI